MTTEEKAKAYDEALERAKAYHRNELAGTRQEMTEYIFPELRESDDERIRKEMIKYFTEIKSTVPIGSPNHFDRYIAYLEKQKKSSTDYFSTNHIETFPDGTTVRHTIGYLEKQKEQKPIEDVIKDITKNKESAIKFLKSAGIMDDNGELAEMYRSEQKPSEWSEEDKDMLKKISYKISQHQGYGDRDIFTPEESEFMASFESLRPQPKQEWSEEDKNELATIISVIEDDKADAVKQYPKCKALHNAYDRMLHFLKSLRPSWKPSEEQMEALNTLLCVGDFSYVGQATKL